MEAPKISITKNGTTLKFSQTLSIPGSALEGIDLKRGDTLTLDITSSFDIDEIAKMIEGQAPPNAPPGWSRRITETVLTEGMKTAVAEAIKAAAKNLLG